MIEVFGSGRVGVKISPRNDFNSQSDTNPDETVQYVIQELNKRNVAFLEVTEGLATGANNDITTIKDPFSAKYKKQFKGTWVANYGYTQDVANEHIKNEQADVVTFGWPYLANPDLIEKFKTGAPQNSIKYIKDMSNFAGLVYFGGPLGYTDLTPYSPNQ